MTSTELFYFGISVVSALVSAFLFFRKPQEELDKRQSVDQKDVEGKASLLTQQVQWEKEANEKRFSEMSAKLDKALELALNHTHTIESKLDAHIFTQNARNESFSNGQTEILTILRERLPKTTI